MAERGARTLDIVTTTATSPPGALPLHPDILPDT
jgi:hypothetical protein